MVLTAEGAKGNAMWSYAEIKRACKPLPRAEGPKLPAKGSAGQSIMVRAQERGNGISWTEYGQRMRAQIWSDAPFPGLVWLRVFLADAAFADEMRLAECDAKTGVLGNVRAQPYTCNGTPAHSHDGSECYSYGCKGCREAEAILAARMSLESDSQAA
jgi:hypothetical protein